MQAFVEKDAKDLIFSGKNPEFLTCDIALLLYGRLMQIPILSRPATQ
jgi:hypothetical protein